LIQHSNIPPKYQYKFMHTIDMRMNEAGSISLLASHDWASSLVMNFSGSRPSQGMYLHGNTGSGKTLMACVILNELIFRYNANCRYAKITKDFLDPIRDSYRDN